MVKSRMKLAKNRNGVVKTGRPVQMVAIQANTPTARQRDDDRGGGKKLSDTFGRPVANM